MNRDLLLLDGDCGLCHRIAIFMDERLAEGINIGYRPINSVEAQLLIEELPEYQKKADTVYLLRNKTFFIQSAAAIRCLLYLNWYWKIWFPLFWIIPSPIRDFFYNIVAKNRHKIFSKPKNCTFRID
jgi:predicted DCC family thiol-disulfide oxidoreductase YuxK